MMINVDIDACLHPINETFPAGEEAKYEFCYERMEFEIKKFGSLFGEVIDWKIVETNGLEVLTTYSKDLKAICYLTRAWIEQAGFSGLERGLSLFSKNLTLFGNSLYPRRKRARDGAVEWFISQLESVLPKLALQDTSWEEASSCLALISEVEDKYQHIFSDSDVAFFNVSSVIKNVIAHLPQAESDDSATVDYQEVIVSDPVDVAPEATPPTLAVPMPPAAQPIKKEIEIDTDFSSPSVAKKTLKKIAEFMLYSNVGDSLAYRLHRYATWCDIDELPPHDNDNKSPISLAVSQDKLSEYKEKAQQETDHEVLKHLEKTLADVPFWLSGHYLMYQMLNNLNHEAAAEAVKQETILFVQSLKGIETLSFSNSEPFADEATIKWLASRTAALTSTPNTFLEDDLSSEDPVTLATLGDYVSLIAQGLAADTSGRGQLILHLKLIKAYHLVGLLPLCLPYIEKIWVIREEINLMSWEPHLCKQFDVLVEKTMMEMYPAKDLMPEKYQQWLSTYK